jgi:hypothetical protein
VLLAFQAIAGVPFEPDERKRLHGIV